MDSSRQRDRYWNFFDGLVGESKTDGRPLWSAALGEDLQFVGSPFEGLFSGASIQNRNYSERQWFPKETIMKFLV